MWGRAVLISGLCEHNFFPIHEDILKHAQFHVWVQTYPQLHVCITKYLSFHVCWMICQPLPVFITIYPWLHVDNYASLNVPHHRVGVTIYPPPRHAGFGNLSSTSCMCHDQSTTSPPFILVWESCKIEGCVTVRGTSVFQYKPSSCCNW